MAMLDKLKDRFGRGGTERQYEYECINCGADFESPHVKMNKVRCPECHSGNARMADRT